MGQEFRQDLAKMDGLYSKTLESLLNRLKWMGVAKLCWDRTTLEPPALIHLVPGVGGLNPKLSWLSTG